MEKITHNLSEEYLQTLSEEEHIRLHAYVELLREKYGKEARDKRGEH